MKYVALLRGINVGGNNIIKMEQLRACFEAGGFQRIMTYIGYDHQELHDNAKTPRTHGAAITAAIRQRLPSLLE